MFVCVALLVAARVAASPPQLCDEEPAASIPRPLWSELAPPGGSGYPDYQTVTHNLQNPGSLRLLASALTRALQSLPELASGVEDPETAGRCVCCLSSNCAQPEIHLDVVRRECTAAQCGALESPDYPIWLPGDLFKSSANAARFTLDYLGFLDNAQSSVSEISQTLQSAGSDLGNLQSLIALYADSVDLLSEGFHLGGYSTERPNLHLCVGYGGDGALAQLPNLSGEVSMGSRYRSLNLSGEQRAQFRSGGFAVSVFGQSLSVLPGIEADLQMDGFKLWRAAAPFGIDLDVVGSLCRDGQGFTIADMWKYDLFHLLDSAGELMPLDTSGDGCLQAAELNVKDFYPARYVTKIGHTPQTWPRATFPYDWEKRNTAVFAVGLNLPVDLKPVEKLIPPTGIALFPGATLYPKLTLKAGAEWSLKANGLRDRLQAAINKHISGAEQIGAADFERSLYPLQAPDASEDNGVSVYAKPRIAADLVLGIALQRFLSLGITTRLGTSTSVEPAAHGGVHDLNVSFGFALLHGNPPLDEPCTPILDDEKSAVCSNELFHKYDAEAGLGLVNLSAGAYSCSTDQAVAFHCQEPEQDRGCQPASASADCPSTHECIAQYGCEAHGYCTRTLDVGGDAIDGTEDDVVEVTHDTTYAACVADTVCSAAAVNAGTRCTSDADCRGATQCVGGANAGAPCGSDDECPLGSCDAPLAACVVTSAAGYFTPYQCVLQDKPSITGWQGRGCHPLTVGFSTACVCESNDDCVAGVETCENGSCVTNGQPVVCGCDPEHPSCSTGRACHEGACVFDCVAHGQADCFGGRTCINGTCTKDGVPFAEHVVGLARGKARPRYEVSSYALSEISASAILDAGLWIGLDLKLSRKLYHFSILQRSGYWPLLGLNKTFYQAGLEAHYENDCALLTGNTVSNWQPGTSRVNRYNPFNAPYPQFDNAGTLADLQSWCLNALADDVSEPQVPDSGGISTSLTDLLSWGEKIGSEAWSRGGLCVVGSAAGVATSVPFTQWLNSVHSDPSGLQCIYRQDPLHSSFPCSDLQNELMRTWGCLEVNANPWGTALAAGFPNTVDGSANPPMFDLSLMLDDPAAALTFDNLPPQIRHYRSHAGDFWLAAVTQCFEQGYAAMQPGDIELVGVDIGPCCGNGVRDTGGCASGPGVPPCEECDDGNTNSNDGCSPLCRNEDYSFNLGVCGNGVVDRQDLEACDDGNQTGGDGCEPDCTLTQTDVTPAPSRTPTHRKTPTVTPTLAPLCAGDCDGLGGVSIAELVTGVNIALGHAPSDACPHGISNGANVDYALIVQAVRNALRGCGGS